MDRQCGSSQQAVHFAAAGLVAGHYEGGAGGRRPGVHHGPIPATQRVLERSKLDLGAIDVFEANEAFAPVVAAWEAEIGAPSERVNPNGGAIALVHPLARRERGS